MDIKGCRVDECGSKDISLWAIKKKDWICKFHTKEKYKSYYLKNRTHYINRSKKQYIDNDSGYGTKQWAIITLAGLRYFDKQKLKKTTVDFDKDWYLCFIKKPCFYCNDTQDRISSDRINNELGHNKENLVPCCYTCNQTRMDHFTMDEMKILGRSISKIKKMRRL